MVDLLLDQSAVPACVCKPAPKTADEHLDHFNSSPAGGENSRDDRAHFVLDLSEASSGHAMVTLE